MSILIARSHFFRIAFAMLAVAMSNLTAFAAQTAYDSGDPTPDEQYVLELINRARKDPTAEGVRLKIDINEGLPAGTTAVARPPLAMSKLLLSSAKAHSLDMYTRSFFAHTNPDGKDPFQRIAATGYKDKSSGENIAAAGSNLNAGGLEDLLMLDTGLSGRGHRVNLLNIGSSTVFREIGVGYSTNATANAQNFKNFLTQDFGTATEDTPFLVGVIYKDTNGNGFYDQGEGLSGVTVTPDSGNFMAITGTAGGYAIPVASSGTIMVTASGGGLSAPMTFPVTLSSNNVKLDFIAGSVSATAPKITSALAASATVGTAFTYTITASGTTPVTFDATPMPGGLLFSGATISGTPTTAGTFNVALTATNSAGKDSQSLVITVAASGGGSTALKITSSLSATATVGAAFTYTIAASGTTPVTFDATPLPDGLTLSGATISGTPTKAGAFIVNLTATNTAGKDTQSLTITVSASGGAIVSKSNTDTDGDGFADEIETALGTSPTNKSDTPFSGAPAGTPVPLTMAKAQIKLNFSGQTEKDSITLTGQLPIPDAYSPLNKKVVIDVGGVVRVFTLSDVGAGLTATGDTLKLKFKAVKHVVSAQTGTFSAKFLKGTFSSLLSDEGLVDATVTSNVNVPVIILFENKIYNATWPMSYKATQGKTGTAK